MVVICPKCKVKLKVADEKIATDGTRFKCPKCGTVLLVKRPVARAKPLDKRKILIAHEDPSIMERLLTVLTSGGYDVVRATDGVQAMVNAAKDLPFLAILSVAIPKIYGFEVCKRLKSRPETKDMKVILLASVYDQRRYRREPQNLHGADDYLEEHNIEDTLIEKINLLKGIVEEPVAPPGKVEKVIEKVVDKVTAETPVKEIGEPKREEVRPKTPMETQSAETAALVERAKRLARTIISDIYLYSKAKVDESVISNTFHKVFASELREGLKLYENRVPAAIRNSGDYFNEAMNNFIEKRKKELS